MSKGWFTVRFDAEVPPLGSHQRTGRWRWWRNQKLAVQIIRHWLRRAKIKATSGVKNFSSHHLKFIRYPWSEQARQTTKTCKLLRCSADHSLNSNCSTVQCPELLICICWVLLYSSESKFTILKCNFFTQKSLSLSIAFSRTTKIFNSLKCSEGFSIEKFLFSVLNYKRILVCCPLLTLSGYITSIYPLLFWWNI